jgi:Tfp pilus assembly protein PilF
MIELVLQAEQALGTGRLDQAEKLYWQVVESDARNAIAIVGLARVAIERGDEQTAREFARRALELDPENAAALRLTSRLAGDD